MFLSSWPEQNRPFTDRNVDTAPGKLNTCIGRFSEMYIRAGESHSCKYQINVLVFNSIP